MTDKPKKNKTPEKEETPTPTIAPAIDPRTGGRGTKVMTIGAGAVGFTVTYASMIQGVARHYVMLDINEPRVKAEALDIAQGSQFAPVSTVEGSSDIAVIKDPDAVVITAGAKRKPGQSRLELAEATIDTMKSIVPKTVEQAPDVIYLMAVNPVDVVIYAGWKLSGFSDGRFSGSGTVLDSFWLRYPIALACGVAPQNVHAYIVGEYGDSEISLWSPVMVGAVSLSQWGQAVDGKLLDDGVREAIHYGVIRSAYNIVEGKGVTNYTTGISAALILGSIVRDEHRMFPVSSYLEDWLGISDVCMPVPSIVDRAGIGRRFVPVATPREYGGLRRSADSIRDVTRQFGF